MTATSTTKNSSKNTHGFKMIGAEQKFVLHLIFMLDFPGLRGYLYGRYAKAYKTASRLIQRSGSYEHP